MSAIGPSLNIIPRSRVSVGGVGGFQPPLIGTTNPSVYADFAAGHYWASGAAQPSFAAFMTAAGGTYSNASGKYVTNSSGVLTAVAANTVPFNYRWNGTIFASAGVLLEGASTNIIGQSNGLSSIAWTFESESVVQGVTDPAGGATGWTMTDASGGAHARQYTTGTMTASLPYTFSLYAKAGTLGFVFMGMQDAGAVNMYSANFSLSGNGSVTSTTTGGTPASPSSAITPLGNGWYRCSVTITNNATTGAGYMQFGLSNTATPTWNAAGYPTYTATGTGTALFFGVQVEQLAFASSYIVTTSVAVTRPADSFTLAPAGGFNLTAETLFGWCSDYALPNTGTIGLVALNNAAATNRINLLLGSATTGQALASSGGTVEFTLTPAGLVAGGRNKCSVSASVATGGIAVINAGTAVTGTMAAMPVSLTTMDIGFVDALTADSLFGDVAAIGTWPVAATAAQLQALTT